MRQRFLLDPPRVGVYLALILAACHAGAPPSLLPATAVAVERDSVRSWVLATEPRNNVLHRFKWQFQDDRSAAGGRGSARIAVPDSLRFDVAGPLGTGRSAAVVVGDSAIWVDPEKSIHDLVPDYDLLWAMFGTARMPDSAATLRGLDEGAGRISWEYADGPDTVSYARTPGSRSRFFAEVRHAGKVVGRVETSLAADGQPLSSRLTVPSVPARLDVTFYSSVPTAAFPPDIWRPRQP
ncbi:MAG: hypothetical protein ABJD11_09130 [Gemmatimonadota bacterium]